MPCPLDLAVNHIKLPFSSTFIFSAVSFPFCLSSYTSGSLKLALRSFQLTQRPPGFEKSNVTLLPSINLCSSSSLFPRFSFYFIFLVCFHVCYFYLLSFLYLHSSLLQVNSGFLDFLSVMLYKDFNPFSNPFIIFLSSCPFLFPSFPPFLTLCLRFSSPFVYFPLSFCPLPCPTLRPCSEK